MMQQLRHTLFRMFVFTNTSRLRFLGGLQVQSRLGVSTRESMELQARITRDHQIRRLADMSLSSIQSGQSFASRYAASGYFAEADARLLMAGDRLGALSDTIELLKRESAPEESFANVAILGNAQWIAGLVAMLILTMYAVQYESLMSLGNSEPQPFFQIGRWLNANLWWVVAIILAAMMGYSVLRQRLTGQLRLRLRSLGIFAIYDQQQIIRICELLKVMFSAGAPQQDAVDEAIGIQPRSRKPGYVETALRRIQTSMAKGESFAQSFSDHLLSDEHAALLLLQEGDGTPANLARACEVMIDALRISTRQQLTIVTGLVAGVFALGSFALLIPMINVLMGAGMSSDF